jgi:hypothetical protein
MFKWTKRIVLGALVLGGLAALTVATGAYSYVRSAGNMLQSKVQNAISFELEIQRARDTLADLVPEMHANLRLVAAEEVEVANLEKEMTEDHEALERQRQRVQTLRTSLRSEKVAFDFGGRGYTRAEVVEELSRGLEQLKTGEVLLTGKEELLKNRRRSLDAALQKLEKTRTARVELAAQIQSLDAQFRLVEAQSKGSEFRLDSSKLAETQNIIALLKKRLAVAQRVLAREARFVEMIPLESEGEDEVIERVDAYLSGAADEAEAARAPTSTL